MPGKVSAGEGEEAVTPPLFQAYAGKRASTRIMITPTQILFEQLLVTTVGSAMCLFIICPSPTLRIYAPEVYTS